MTTRTRTETAEVKAGKQRLVKMLNQALELEPIEELKILLAQR